MRRHSKTEKSILFFGVENIVKILFQKQTSADLLHSLALLHIYKVWSLKAKTQTFWFDHFLNTFFTMQIARNLLNFFPLNTFKHLVNQIEIYVSQTFFFLSWRKERKRHETKALWDAVKARFIKQKKIFHIYKAFYFVKKKHRRNRRNIYSMEKCMIVRSQPNENVWNFLLFMQFKNLLQYLKVTNWKQK